MMGKHWAPEPMTFACRHIELRVLIALHNVHPICSLLLFEEDSEQGHTGFLEQDHHCFIQGIPVLLWPPCDMVSHLERSRGEEA